IDRCFGEENERAIVLFSPNREIARQAQSIFGIADEIVIDNEYTIAPSQLAQPVQLRNYLSGRFESRLASVDRNDVAEFALEGAPARELDRHRPVLLPAQQIESRNWAAGHIGLIVCPVNSASSALFEGGCNIGKDFLGLADQDMIGQFLQGLWFAARPRTTDEGSYAKSSSAGKNRSGIGLLGVHSTDHYEIGPLVVLVGYFIESMIQQTQSPARRAKRGNCNKTQRWHVGFLLQHCQNAFKSPKRPGEARPHQQDLQGLSERGKRGLHRRSLACRKIPLSI